MLRIKIKQSYEGAAFDVMVKKSLIFELRTELESLWLSGEGLSYIEGLPGLQVERQRSWGHLKMLRDSKGAGTAGTE